MPTAYAITRQRTLRGMGTTYSFVPRGVRGMGQLTPPDIGLPPIVAPPELIPPAPGPTTPPPSFYTLNPPIAPYSPQGPLAPPPNIVAAAPMPTAPGFTLVFPSQGQSTYSPVAPPPGTSWLDQTTGGIPNMYLAIGTVGFVLLVSLGGKRRR
jgi:hypothetical protein